jgi:hypothetical protein
MEVEENQLLDGLIVELRRDTALLIEKLGVDTTAADRFHEGSDRYQDVSNDFEKLQYVQHKLAVTTKGDQAWQNTELSNRRTGHYLSEQLKCVKKTLQDNNEGSGPGRK